jgi:predicted enzyme related to lactoylglutathione lyase
MPTKVYQIVIDVDDIDRSAHFWSEVLGLKVSHRWEQFLGFERQKGGLKVVLQIVPEKKTSKNRMHLDVAVEDVDAASARVEALGGMKLQVLSCSQGRYYCVLATEAVDIGANTDTLIPRQN